MINSKERKEILNLVLNESNLAVWTYNILEDKFSGDSIMCDLFGLKKEKFSGSLDWYKSHIHPEDKNRIDTEIQGILASQESFISDFKILLPDNSIRRISCKCTIQVNDKGESIGISGISWAKTASKQKDKNSVISMQTKLFVEQASTSMAVFDNNMIYLCASKKWYLDYDLREEDIIGKSQFEIFPKVDKYWKAIYQDSLNGGVNRGEEDFFLRTDGTSLWLKWETRPWYIEKDMIGGLVIHSQDITRQLELQSEEKKWQAILKKTSEISRIGAWELKFHPVPELIWSSVTKEIHEVSHDYTPNLETGINFYTEGKSREEITKVVNDAIEKGISYDVELEIKTKKNNLKWVRAIGISEKKNGETVKLYGIFQDLTERKRSEKHLEYHSQLLQNVSDAIISTNIDFEVQSWNRAAEKLYGWSVKEAIGRPVQELISQEFLSAEENTEKANEILLGNGYYENEVLHHTKNGEKLNVWTKVTILKDDNGNQVGAVGVNHDITERKKHENLILNTLEEKEVLLKEIHHRVKNNLQIIWGLLDIQEKRNQKSEIKSALMDSKARIDTMALIHENLYQGKDLAHVDLGQYLNKLLGNIGSMYSDSDRKIEILIGIKGIEFGLDITIPLALIINELITNAYKHAFTKRQHGKIAINVSKKEEQFIFRIEDDGDGFPEGYDVDNTNSLGIKLIHNLCRQLDATISFQSKENTGTKVFIAFYDKD